ncbi:hypothetical protein N9M50_03040 [Alphaproteobacteria bacterium]|nr:hypothetical protein [Alphaproteobacteria bacterium]
MEQSLHEKILWSGKRQLAGVRVVVEISSWDSFKQVSFIFDRSEVSEMSDQQLSNLITNNVNGFSNKEFSINRVDNKIFVNTSIDELFED